MQSKKDHTCQVGDPVMIELPQVVKCGTDAHTGQFPTMSVNDDGTLRMRKDDAVDTYNICDRVPCHQWVMCAQSHDHGGTCSRWHVGGQMELSRATSCDPSVQKLEDGISQLKEFRIQNKWCKFIGKRQRIEGLQNGNSGFLQFATEWLASTWNAIEIPTVCWMTNNWITSQPWFPSVSNLAMIQRNWQPSCAVKNSESKQNTISSKAFQFHFSQFLVFISQSQHAVHSDIAHVKRVNT